MNWASYGPCIATHGLPRPMKAANDEGRKPLSPEGATDNSPALQRRDTIGEMMAVPEGRLKLTPNVGRVIFDSVLLEKRQELFFKSTFVMMFGLGTDVRDRICLLRDAH